MQHSILFLHDTSLKTPRGAELTINQLLNLGAQKGYVMDIDDLKDFEVTKAKLTHADLVILNSSSRCHYELPLLQYILDQNIPFIKVEYDYNFCIRRNILCTVDRSIRSCCHTEKFHLYRKLFRASLLNIFQSPKHFEAHYEFYGEAVKGHLIMPPTVEVSQLNISKEKNDKTIPFFGDLNFLKGGHQFVDFAKQHPETSFVVYGKNLLRRELPANISFHEPIENKEVLKILGRTKTLFCQPVWPEPSGRLVAEAFLSGCEIVGNERIGTFSFDFYPDHKEQAITEIQKAPLNFWNHVQDILEGKSLKPTVNLGKVLVYKSYGGLGDIFFAIPAIYKLAQVVEELHFAVAPRLVEFFSKHLTQVKVVCEEDAKQSEAYYDNVYELGNYPAFRGYDLPHALTYPTHKKVKQHAIQHYIDTIAKLHPDIDTHLEVYPYFQHQVERERPYYVVHHGAGFLLKIWPTEKFAQLIERLHEIFPNLSCKIIKGPDDPDIAPYFTKKYSHIEYITGGMVDVGNVMSGALFHIGNDAGITHVAGSFNVPSVGIYGPTGPGSWGSFATYNELIWGKQGVCNLKCNYDVILNCEHRVCLTSVTVERVLAALFKLLQRAYAQDTKWIKVNPMARIEFNKHDSIVSINEEDVLIEYHSEEMKSTIENLLKEVKVDMTSDMRLILDVLQKREIVFQIPSFERTALNARM